MIRVVKLGFGRGYGRFIMESGGVLFIFIFLFCDRLVKEKNKVVSFISSKKLYLDFRLFFLLPFGLIWINPEWVEIWKVLQGLWTEILSVSPGIHAASYCTYGNQTILLCHTCLVVDAICKKRSLVVLCLMFSLES